MSERSERIVRLSIKLSADVPHGVAERGEETA